MGEHADRDLERLFALDAGAGPALALDDARSSAIIAGALGGAGFPPPMPGGPGGALGGGKVAASAAAKGIAAGKLTLLAGGAVTALATIAWLAVRSPVAPSAVSVPRAPLSSPTDNAAPAVSPPPIAAGPSATAHDLAASSVDESPPALVGHAPAAKPARDRRPAITASEPARGATASSGSRRRASTPAVAPAQEPIATPAAMTPEDLLAEANAARVAYRWRDADALYARVAAGEPASLAVQTALVASASIHLEHLADPSGAARRFRAALAAGPRAALAEDARWGLAEAARVTGDSAAELHALDDFLAHHAGSPRAPRARARRTELGAAP
jgi:hypothetical protein